ncbi:MAG: glucoamylase family protein, partial [Ferruginibacter sp.]
MKLRKTTLLFALIFSLVSHAQETLYNYSFFTNSGMPGFYFFSKTNAKSSSIKNIDQKLPVSKTIFHTPGNSLQLEYVNAKNGHWQAIIYHPDIRGQDHFKRVKYLSFWVYNPSISTGENDLPSVQLIKIDSSIGANFEFETGGINSWKQVLIPVDLNTNPDDPAAIIGIGFSQKKDDGKKHTIYIDDIEFLSTDQASSIKATPVIDHAIGAAKHIDISWKPALDSAIRFVKIYRSAGSKNYQPVGIQSPLISRYADFTGETGKTYSYKISFLNNKYQESMLSAPVSAKTKPMTDDELLTMVQEASFRYYWEGAEKISGLAKENMLGREEMIAAGASGFGIMALIAGTERKFITRKQSVDRFVRIVNFLEKAETFHGVFPHFIDGATGKVIPFFGMKDNGGDLVETSFLLQGLLTARAYFTGKDSSERMIREKITAIWNKIEWDWYKQHADSKFLYWHWSPDQGWVINHTLIGWNEVMVTYLLAIASPTHSIPASMYYTGWANQDSTGQKYRSNWGGTMEGSMYYNGKSYYGIKLDVGVSNGGPLFFTHYSYLGYDPHLITDKYTNYFTNNKNIALINYLY